MNISFSMTKRAVRERRKKVTRRMARTWKNLKAGDILMGIEKGQGLKKGEHVVKPGMIRIVNVRLEPLCVITPEDVILEGFDNMTCDKFIEMFCKHNKCEPYEVIRRIEFEYL